MRTKTFFSKPTPTPLRRLLLAILIVSLLCTALEKLFTHTIGIPGPIEVFSLSKLGLEHHLLWQPITYLFLTPSEDGISFFFILRLLFNVYLLWMVGVSVLHQVGTGPFFRLFFISGFFAGLVGLWIIDVSSNPLIISGTSPATYAVLIAWTMLFSELEILVFYSYPIKAKWLVIGFLGLTLLTDLSDGHFVNFLVYFSGVIAGYLYAVFAWGLLSPFKFTHRFDRFATRAIQRVIHACRRLCKPSRDHKRATIYDIHTGEVVVEEESDKTSSGFSNSAK